MSDHEQPHSQRFFTDARDYWWHDDYLGLLARRFDLARARTVLDVGTGQGHFARAWARHLAPDFSLTGIDREERSLAVARARCDDLVAREGLQGSFTFVQGAAEALPFEADRFDLVCCQTLLIHVRDPRAVFDEMVRVTRPGGLVLVVEPNNLAGLQRLAARGPQADLEAQLREARFILRCARGKHALGLGWNDLGVHLPSLFRGLRDVAYYTNDRAWVMEPPYARPQERFALTDLRRDVGEGVYAWPRAEALRYYLAGGGSEADFTLDYDGLLASQAEELHRCDEGAWVDLTAFAGLIAAGRKP